MICNECEKSMESSVCEDVTCCEECPCYVCEYEDSDDCTLDLTQYRNKQEC